MEMVIVSKSELIDLIREELGSLRPSIALPEKNENDLVGVDGIVALTGWAKQTIYTKHSLGEFPKNCVFKRGRKLFFSKSSIIAWIKSGKQ